MAVLLAAASSQILMPPGGFGMELEFFLFLFLPILLAVVGVSIFCRFQMSVASRFTPIFYRHGMFWIIRIACGRKYSAWALNNYASKLFEDKRYDDSFEAYTHAIYLDRESVHHWAHRGIVRYNQGDHQNAIEDLSAALNIDSTYQLALAYRAYSLMAIQDYSKALEDLQRVECHSHQHSSIAYFRGYLREFFGQWQSAYDDYALSFQLDTANTSAGIALARLQAGCPDESLRDASKAIENATNLCVRANWSDWIAISVLGAAYSEAGDFEHAVKYAKMALQQAPDDEKPGRIERIIQFENMQPFRIQKINEKL